MGEAATRNALILLLVASLGGASLAQPTTGKPSTSVPGAIQPVAPGAKPGPTLPTLALRQPLKEVLKVEYASNGFMEVANAIVLAPADETSPRRELQLAQGAVLRSFWTRGSLSEVDVSVYQKEGYEGAGGPLPLLTASVPRGRLDEFARLTSDNLASFDRLWVNPERSTGFTPPAKQPLQALEQGPTYKGTLSTPAREKARSQHEGLRNGLVFRGPGGRPLAALTFDDAPHPLYEPLLLDLLRRSGVRATFFCIGRNAQAYPYFVRDMIAAGHEVGNHTYHHVRLPGLSEAEVRDELSLANSVLQGITGQAVTYFRPPGGDYTLRNLGVARSLGLTTVFWTDDPADFNNPGDTVIVTRLERSLRRGGIVLLHDNVLETLQVLPAFLRYAFARGTKLTTVSEMLARPTTS